MFIECRNIIRSLSIRPTLHQMTNIPITNFPNMQQVVVDTLEANQLWNTILMDFLGSQHQLSGPGEKLSQSIGQLELDIKVDTLTDSVRYHQVALAK